MIEKSDSSPEMEDRPDGRLAGILGTNMMGS